MTGGAVMHLEPNFPVQIEMEASNKVCTEKGDTGECELRNDKKRETDSIEPESSSTSFVIDFSDANKTENNSLQEAFLKYREKKKNELIHATKKKKKKAKHHDPSCPKRMAKLRNKFLKQAMKYIGTPYARKHWSKDSPEYSSPYFLDCCGLVRRVLWDLKKDFGFKIGRWNQAYMYDTLPITVEREEDMKPGDLVFMSGIYNNPKSKKQIHNMTHVEIWYGEGTKVLGSRWNNGKVSIFDHYQFEAKSFHSSVYHFKSIDTWLKGICKSFCPEHPWRRSRFRSKPRKKSVFNIDKQLNEERGQASLSAEGETDMQSVASFSDLSSAKSTQSDGDKMEAAQIQEAEQAEGQPQENDSRATVASSPSKNSIFLTEIVSSSDAKPTICDFYREDTESLEDSDVSQDSPRPKSKNLNEIDSIKQKVDVSTDSVDSLHIGDLDLHSCDKCSENPLPKETTGDLTTDFTRINNILGDMGAMSCDPSHIKSGFDSFDDDTDSDVSFSDEDYNVRFGTSTVSDANGKQATNRSQEPSSGGSAENSESEAPSDGNKREKNNGSGKRSPGDKGEGGGGKKQPFKSPKPPNCSLPPNTVPTYFIGGGNGVALVDNSLQKLGWKRISDKYDEKFKLKWTECKININWSSFREGEQLVNHIPNCNLLTNKFGLLKTLQEYERVTLNTKGRTPRLKFTEFHPETYVLDESSDREAFLDTYKDGELWISKPTGMNQGKGIYIIRSRDEVMKTLEERDEKAKTRKRHKPLMSRIMQRYITNPLLLDGRKFDIRAYMLIASTVPYLVLHHKGYLRLTCQKYDGEDTDLSKHLTNQGIQKKDENYAEMKEETVWSMEKFNDYINEQVAADKGLEENWVHNSLTRQMRKIMLHCFNSVKKKLQTKCGYFGLYGFDFMIDQNMKVWLIEVNVNPAIHTQCGTLQEVIPQMVEETLYLSIECFEKTKRNHVLLPLKSQKNFYILHCGKLWGATAPRQTRSVSPVKESSDQTKVPQARRSVSPARSVPKPVVKQVQVSLPLPTKPAQTSATSTSISVPPKKSDISLPPLKTNSNEEIKLKMTHNSAGTSSVRGKSERGN